jgi:hypothetical protein
MVSSYCNSANIDCPIKEKGTEKNNKLTCYGLNVFLQNFYVEALSLNVIPCGEEPFG